MAARTPQVPGTCFYAAMLVTGRLGLSLGHLLAMVGRRIDWVIRLTLASDVVIMR